MGVGVDGERSSPRRAVAARGVAARGVAARAVAARAVAARTVAARTVAALAVVVPAVVTPAVVVAGAALRVWGWAAGRPLWLDEEMIAMNLRDRGYARLAGQLAENQSAPLGWLWLQRLMVDMFGTGERTLRLVPLLFGIGTLVVGWLVGRRYLGVVGTVALVGFCAVNESLVRYSTEVKHYSADFFWVLLLLGLAARVVERPTLGRSAAWWAVAAVGGWLSMGAIVAVPGLALVLFGTAVWRRQWTAARDLALPGVAWLASFGLQYQLSLRFTAGSDYLADFWDGLGYPPRSGPLSVARWLLARPAALAADPLHLNAGLPGELLPKIVGGLFWLLVAAGLVVAARRRPAYAGLLAAPAVSALVLRLALWLVPALFVAVAVALDAAGRWSGRRLGSGRLVSGRLVSGRLGSGQLGSGQLVAGRPRSRRLSSARAAVPVVVVIGCLAPLTTLVPFGVSAVAFTTARPAVDDRAAVAWMQAVHRPGDLVLAVGSATRALQWYDPDQTLRPWRMVLPTLAGAGCDPAGLVNATSAYKRVLAYSGIRTHPYKHAHQVLARRLRELGTATQTRAFGAGGSIVYLVELRRPPPVRPAGGECIVTR
jgi:hypothetical protein